MKDIGKFTGNYLYVLAAFSLLSMPYSWLIQQGRSVEFSWVFLLWVGTLLRKHSNKARLVTIGFNLFMLIACAVLISIGVFKKELINFEFNQSIQLFACKIHNSSIIMTSTFIVIMYGLSIALITLLLTNKAKEEFSNK